MAGFMDTPLVSLIVITYNSSNFILEGLESIKNQTYKNVELVISDDCSTDNTVEVCKKWLQENKQYFKNTRLVTSEKNTGVAPNANRAIKASSGEWIKGLAGDDKLLPNSIEEYVNFVNSHPDCQIVFSKLHFWGEDKENIAKVEAYYKTFYKEIKNPKNQYKRYLKQHFIPGTGLFFKRSMYDKIGGFDENYPMCEEFPFNLKVLKVTNVWFLDKELYGYNVREDSISNALAPNYRNFMDRWRFFKDVKSKEQIKKGLIFHAFSEFIYFNYQYNVHFRKNKVKRHFYSILKYTNPLSLYNIIIKIFR